MNYPEHGKYEWLPILYDFVATLKPKKIIEFGPGSGYTTICMAKSLEENKIDGHIYSYDIWNDDYWGKRSVTQTEYNAWGVSEYITLNHLDFFEWIQKPEEFDFMFFDINNTSEKLLKLCDRPTPRSADEDHLFSSIALLDMNLFPQVFS